MSILLDIGFYCDRIVVNERLKHKQKENGNGKQNKKIQSKRKLLNQINL